MANSMVRLFALVLVPLVLAACGAGSGAEGPDNLPLDQIGPSWEEEAWALRLLDLTNAVRARHGLSPLAYDPAASLAAYRHAVDMDLRGYFDHVSPDGESPHDRCKSVGVNAAWVGENLARGQATPEEVLRAWLDSPQHSANLLYPWWTRVGIAVHRRPGAGPWWAADYLLDDGQP